MTERLIIGLDSSTQSTKAIAWTKQGDIVALGRADIPMAVLPQARYEQCPDDWWTSACAALRELCSKIDPTLVDAMAISNQRETIGFFDDHLKPIHPAIVWLDTRSINEVDELYEIIGEERLHRISGKPKDITPSHSRLLWLKKTLPDVLKQCTKISDVNSYLSARLTGHRVTSWASADPSGLFDIEKKHWSDTILDAIGVSPSKLARTTAPGQLIGTVQPKAAAQTGLLAGTKLFAGAGDGQCAGLGVNALCNGRVYLNLGTAIVMGSWSVTPNISKGWRTLISPTGEGYLLEGVMRAGTFFMDWLVENYVSKDADVATHAALQSAAKDIPIGTRGLLVCPFLSGCMNPYWDMSARAAFFGVSPVHDAAHLYRGALEALTGEIARSILEMRVKGLVINEIVAVGGGANSALWRKMLVDATNLPLTLSKSLEASSLGAGIIAAKGAGWYETFNDAANGMSAIGETFQADKAAHEKWKPLLRRQQEFNAFCCNTPLSDEQ